MLRWRSRKMRVVPHRTEAAAAAIGRLEPGTMTMIITSGEWSLIDALEHLLDECKCRCRVDISGWTYGRYDCHRLNEMRNDQRITDLRLISDASTYDASPTFRREIKQILGPDVVRCCNSHAKTMIVSTDVRPRQRAVVRSSMNLNKNLRIEQFDLSVDVPAIADHCQSWFDDLWDCCGISGWTQGQIVDAVYLADDPAAEPATATAAPNHRSGRAGQTVSLSDLDI